MEQNQSPNSDKPTNLGMAEYLAQFDKSPYSYPANDRQVVQGESTLKGSWRPINE